MKRLTDVEHQADNRTPTRVAHMIKDLRAWQPAPHGSPVGLFRWQRGPKRVTCDATMLFNLLGLPAAWSDVSIERWLERVHPDDRDNLRSLINHPDRPLSMHCDLTYRILHAEGHWVQMMQHSQWSSHGDGQDEILALCYMSPAAECTAIRSCNEPAFRAIIESSSDIIICFDLDLRCRYLNRSITRYFHFPPSRYIGKTMQQSGWPDSWSQPLEQALHQVVQTRTELEIELELGQRGTHFVFDARLVPEFDSTGAVSSLVCIARDITEASQARRLLIEENAVLEMIADSLPINHILLSIGKMIESQLSNGMCSIMRVDSSGCSLSLAAAPSLPADYCQLIADSPIGPETGACGSAAYWKRSIIVNDIASSPLWNKLKASAYSYGLKACWSTPIFSSEHQFLGTLAIYYTEPRSPSAAELRLIYRCSHIAAIALQRNLHEAQLYSLATQDCLTHLYNRRHFIETSEKHLKQARRYHQPVSVLMLDLDHFKQFNDQYGHAVGDKILTLFARICQQTLRTADIIGRMGGEEFAALLPGTGLHEARHVAERLRQQVEQAELTEDHRTVHFQVSIGVAALQDNENIDHLLARADTRLYQAKTGGRNRVCI